MARAGGRSPASHRRSMTRDGEDENDNRYGDADNEGKGDESIQRDQIGDQIPLVSWKPWRLDLSAIKMELAAMKSVELALEAPTNEALDFESDEFMASVASQMDDIEMDEETGEIMEEWIEGDGEDGMDILFGAEEVEVDESIDFEESVDEDDEKSSASKSKTTTASSGEEEEDFGDDPEAGKRKRFAKSAISSASRKRIFEARAPQNGNRDNQSSSKSLDSVNLTKVRALRRVQRFLDEMWCYARMAKACTSRANSLVQHANTSNRLV